MIMTMKEAKLKTEKFILLGADLQSDCINFVTSAYADELFSIQRWPTGSQFAHTFQGRLATWPSGYAVGRN